MRNPSIVFEGGLFEKIANLMDHFGLELNKWSLRLGTEVDPGGQTFRKTVIPIKKSEIAPRDIEHIDPNTSLSIIIDDLSLRRYDQTNIGGDGFLKVLEESIKYRLSRDDQMEKFSQDNDLNQVVEFKGQKIPGKALVEFCVIHKRPYDIRNGCPECNNEVSISNEDVEKTKNFGDFLKNRNE